MEKSNFNLLEKLDCQQGAVRAIRFNADGDYVITCGSNKSIKLWTSAYSKDLGSKKQPKLLTSYAGHGNEVLDARASCDNGQIVSCGLDKAVLLWDVGSGKILRNYRGSHAGAVNCIRFNEDSSVAISGSLDATVKCWDLRSKRLEPIQTLTECKDSITSIDVSDHEILVGSADGKIRRYDLRNGSLITDVVGREPITSLSFTKDGQCVLVNSSGNSTIKLFDKANGELLQEYQGHSHQGDFRIEVVLDNTDQKVLAGSEDGKVYIWSLVEGDLITQLDHNTENSTNKNLVISSLSFHPSLPYLCTTAKGLAYFWGPNDNTA